MSRLIDADELLKCIDEGAIRFFVQVPRDHIETVNTVLEHCGIEVKKVINAQPTAYNVDNVVKELGIKSSHANAIKKGDLVVCRIINVTKAISIVRKGGVASGSSPEVK